MDPALLSKAWVATVSDDVTSSRYILDLIGAFGLEVRGFETQHDLLASVDGFDAEAPACVIVDLTDPPTAGFDLHRRLSERSSPVGVVIVTPVSDTSRTVSSMRSGASAVLERPAREDELWSAVQEGLHRSDQEIRRRKHHRLLETRLRGLSPQDRQVLQLLMEGCKNRIIAKRLDVSLRTVENRRRRIFDVMEADSVAQLARQVVEYENDLLPTPPTMGSWVMLPFERVA